MHRLLQLKRTPVRPRHPLVYGAGSFLLIAVMAFIGRIGMVWVLLATTLAVAIAIAPIAIATAKVVANKTQTIPILPMNAITAIDRKSVV